MEFVKIFLENMKKDAILMSGSIAARMFQLLWLPTLLHQSGVRTNLEVTVSYTKIDVMVYSLSLFNWGDRSLRIPKPVFY